MSRIGKLPISLPANVTVTVDKNNVVSVSGPNGKLIQPVHTDIKIQVNNNEIIVERPSDSLEHKSSHGLYRTLIANMIHGVSEGFTIIQELIGVGYKADAKDNILELSLGYSHGIFLEMPPEVKVETINERGKPPTIVLKSADKQLIGLVAAKIRSFRKPEPYKGKGIRFKDEIIRKKAGKSAVQK